MLLTTADCIAKAVEMEQRAEAYPQGRQSYLELAAQWRTIARQAELCGLGGEPRSWAALEEPAKGGPTVGR